MAGLRKTSTLIAAMTTGTLPVSQQLRDGAGLGTPILVTIEVVGSITDGAPSTGARFCAGMSDGATQLAICTVAESGNTSITADGEGRIDDQTVIQVPNANGNVLNGEARFDTSTGFVSGGCDILWDDLPNAAVLMKVDFYYGSDCTATVHKITGSSSTNGTASITGRASRPNYAKGYFAALAPWAHDGTFSEGKIGVGWAAQFKAGDTLYQGCFSYWEADRPVGTTSSKNAMRDDCIAQNLDGSQARLSLDSFNSDGITVKTLDAAAAVNGMIALITCPNKVFVGVPTVFNPADDTTDVGTATGTGSIIAPGFLPQAYDLVASGLTAKNTITTGSAVTSFSWGGHPGSVVASIQTENGAVNSNTRSIAGNNFVAAILNSAGTATLTATHSSYDSLGVNITFTNGTSTRKVLLVAISVDVQTMSPSGIASAEAFGTPTVTASISVAPSGIASAQVFGTATITTGAVTVSPSGIASAQAFGTPTVTATSTISPSGIASAQAFGTPTIATAITLSPTGIASSEAFGTATVTAGTVTVSPSGIPSAETFGTATLTSSITLTPSGIASAEAFGTATVQTTITLSPSGIASAELFGTPTVTAGVVTISPAGIASAEVFGSPVLNQQGGNQTVVAVAISSAEAFGTATITAGVVTVSPSGIASAEAFGTPALTSTITLSPSAIASAELFGTPTVTAGVVTVSPAGIASAEAFGSPTLLTGFTIIPVGIASAEAFGLPLVTVGAVTISPSGIASAEAFGTPALSFTGATTIFVEGIASAEAFGRPFVRGGFIPTTMKKLIHDALCARAHGGTFIEATYPVDDEGCALEQGLQVAPKSVEVNEIRGGSTTDRRSGRALLLDRTRWTWLMILRFDQEVVAELFEDSLDDDPVVVCRDPSDPRGRQVSLSRVDCDYVHPPRGNPSNGTVLRYTFEANLSPK